MEYSILVQGSYAIKFEQKATYLMVFCVCGLNATLLDWLAFGLRSYIQTENNLRQTRRLQLSLHLLMPCASTQRKS